MRSWEEQSWRDYNGPLWSAIEMIAILAGEITAEYLARRWAA